MRRRVFVTGGLAALAVPLLGAHRPKHRQASTTTTTETTMGTSTTVKLGSPVAPAGTALVPDAAGVSGTLTWGNITNAGIDSQVSKMTALGVRRCRLNLSWNMLEPSAKGTISTVNRDSYDYALNKLEAVGIKVLATFGHDVPYWASGDPSKSGGTSWNTHWRPTSFADYADHCTYMMNRWGSKIEIVQIWNEPNNSGFWPSQSTEQARMTEYVGMLQAGHAAVKAVNSSMAVAMGGLSNGNNYPALHYLYLAGGKPYFDLAAWHPYTDNLDPAFEFMETDKITNDPAKQVKAKDSFWGLDTCRQIMIDNGDSAKKVVLTEYGYSTTTGTGGVTEANQAAYLERAWDRIVARSWIARSYWYLLPETGFSGSPDPYGSDWVNKFGLVTSALVDKPAAASFAAKAGVAPASLASSTFTGANGDPWPTATFDATSAGSTGHTSSIQGNRGRLTTGAQGGYNSSVKRAVLASLITTGNYEVRVDWYIGAIEEKFPQLYLRADGVAAGNAYAIQLSPLYNDVKAFSYVAGSRTELATAGFTFAASDTIRMRAQVNGTVFRYRVWKNAEAEPTTWTTLDVTGGHTTGVPVFAVQGGNDAVARSADVDDLVVTAL